MLRVLIIKFSISLAVIAARMIMMINNISLSLHSLKRFAPSSVAVVLIKALPTKLHISFIDRRKIRSKFKLRKLTRPKYMLNQIVV